MNQDSITALAAIQILSITATMYAKDRMGVRLFQDGVKVGKRMGLLDAKPPQSSPYRLLVMRTAGRGTSLLYMGDVQLGIICALAVTVNYLC